MYIPNYIIQIASESFGWWSTPQRKRFSNVLDGGQVMFFDWINVFPTFFFTLPPL